MSCGIVLLQASETHIEHLPQTAVFDLETGPITRTPNFGVLDSGDFKNDLYLHINIVPSDPLNRAPGGG